MIKIKIGNNTRNFTNADEKWINQQINRRRQDGVTPCVRVIIKEGDLDLSLATPTCGSGRGGRAPYDHEKEIVDLWEKLGLNKKGISGGKLVAFLKQLRKLL